MKTSTLAVALTFVSLGMTAAHAGEFDGGYVGGKIGVNRTDMTAVSRQSPVATGLEGGYNWNWNSMLLGVDGFLDFNGKKTHTGAAPAPATVHYGSHVYGLDLKLGLPGDKWMPYAKLGYAHVGGRGEAYASAVGDNGAHLGLGVEYKFAPNWSLAGEWTKNSGKSGATRLDNDNFTLGINYYFGKPNVAPVAVAASAVTKKAEPEAAPVPAPAPTAAPAPAPKETWKTLLEDKPITINGVHFDFDSAKLRPSADKSLSEVVEFANTYKDAQLDISGHTCSMGPDGHNLRLSAGRAESVKAYLVKKGIAASRITTKGYGEEKPVVDNKTIAGRAQNRRVEIRSVLKEEKKVRVVE